MNERIVAGSLQEEDLPLNNALRPRSLQEFVGQDGVKENLSIAIQAARMRGEPLDHVVLYGPPGLGKTTLAHIIASELGVSIRMTSGPAVERPGDMAAILTSLNPGDVLFIDEVHRLSRPVEEVLYSAMEDFTLSWVVGKGLQARNVSLRVNPFTLVGATTRFAMVSGPLRNRFGVVCRLEFYSTEAMCAIVRRSARLLEVEIDDEAVEEIARRARGTPRVANRLLRRVRDFAQVRGTGVVTGEVARQGLDMLGVDELGLDEGDRRLLRALVEKFAGGPVGLDTLSASISEDPDTIMDVYEPYLMQLGFVERTPRGRVATARAYEHLGLPPPAGPQPRLL